MIQMKMAPIQFLNSIEIKINLKIKSNQINYLIRNKN